MQATKLAIVTGANRGLGFEMCKQLATKGYTVLLTARNEHNGKEAQEALRAQGHSNVDFLPLDTQRRDSIDQFADEVEKRYGSVTLLINNAGIYIDGWNEELFNKTMETNFYGTLLLTQRILPIMIKQGSGRIVNMSSGLGQLRNISDAYKEKLAETFNELTAEEFKSKIRFVENDSFMKQHSYTCYNLSKATMNTWTRLLVEKLKKEHPKEAEDILINAADPGWVRTDMGGPSATRSIPEGVDTPLWLATELPKGGPSGQFWNKRQLLSWE